MLRFSLVLLHRGACDLPAFVAEVSDFRKIQNQCEGLVTSARAAEERALQAETDAATTRAEFKRLQRSLREANERICVAEAQITSAVLKVDSADAALRAANERSCVAEAEAAIAVSNLASAVADHKSLDASLIKALGSAKSETASALLSAEQYRLAKCKAIADQQHSEAQNKRSISRITAELKVVSTAADDLRAKCRQADETIAALRSEFKVQQAKVANDASIPSSNTVSPSPRINLSRHLSFAASTPVLEAPSSPSASQPSSAMPSPIPTAPFSTSLSSSSAIRSRIPCPLPTPPASASPSRRIASVSVASPIPAAIGTTEQSPFPLLHCEPNQVYRIASMVCLMAKIAMLSSPSVPDHVLTVSMRGAVFEPIVVDVH